MHTTVWNRYTSSYLWEHESFSGQPLGHYDPCRTIAPMVSDNDCVVDDADENSISPCLVISSRRMWSSAQAEMTPAKYKYRPIKQIQEGRVLRINGETGSFSDVYRISLYSQLQSEPRQIGPNSNRFFFLLQPCLSIFRSRSPGWESVQFIEIGLESRVGAINNNHVRIASMMTTTQLHSP